MVEATLELMETEETETVKCERSDKLLAGTPTEIAKRWYKAEETQGFLNLCCGGSRRVPEDVRSFEFAEWLNTEFRVAMRRGIQIGRQKW